MGISRGIDGNIEFILMWHSIDIFFMPPRFVFIGVYDTIITHTVVIEYMGAVRRIQCKSTMLRTLKR
ncbi:MAG: hypothetical protein APR53_07090 [Methanoculleus sp. SDB]|nr:MAG: hypothetical protein APR53_07090 [Methanoculleus sp. SDB]